MDYNALETEIVGVLAAFLTANSLSDVYGVRVMPENPTALLQDYDAWPGGVVNVQWVDSSYESPMSTSEISQVETVHISCFLQCNAMKGTNGGFALISAVKSALIGYRPTQARTRMWVSDFGEWNVVSDDGQLKPFIQFTCETVAQQSLTNNNLWYPIDSANSVVKGGNLVEVEYGLYDDNDNLLNQVVITGMKKYITVTVGNLSGNVLVDPFFATNMIGEIRADHQSFIVGADFTQTGDAVTGTVTGIQFYVGQVIVVEV